MYAETEIVFHFMKSNSQETHQFEDLFMLSHEMNNLVDTCEYDFGQVSDLFKAHETIIEEPILAIDQLLSRDLVESNDLGSLQRNQHLIDKAFYEAKPSMESPFFNVLDIKDISLVAKTDNVINSGSSLAVYDVPISKSLSYGNSNFLKYTHVDYGKRRAFSENDKKALGVKDAGLVMSPLDRIIVSCTSEDRREKLSRYRNKKSKRNFRRKIKYAYRKTLADNQPRIRGRFAKTEIIVS
ncbi:unnamed protein product [Cochlearia groenlandica]